MNTTDNKLPNDLNQILENAKVPPAVEHRIVEGALARIHQPKTNTALLPVALVFASIVILLGAVSFKYELFSPNNGLNKSRTHLKNIATKTINPDAKIKKERSNETQNTAPSTLIANTTNIQTANINKTPRTPPLIKRNWTTDLESKTFTLAKHTVSLKQNTRVHLISISTQSFELFVEKGVAHFKVHPLKDGQKFWVRTDQLQVEVVGTHFSVEVSDQCTQVNVIEGKVKIHPRLGNPVLLIAKNKQTFCQKPAHPEKMSEEEMILHNALTLLTKNNDFKRAAMLLDEYIHKYPVGIFLEEALFHLILAKKNLGFEQEADQLAHKFLSQFPKSPKATRVRKEIGKPLKQP